MYVTIHTDSRHLSSFIDVNNRRTCFTSHRQRCHLEKASPLIVPCEGHEARFLHCSHRESNPDSRVVVHYTTAAPRQLHIHPGHLQKSTILSSLSSMVAITSLAWRLSACRNDNNEL